MSDVFIFICLFVLIDVISDDVPGGKNQFPCDLVDKLVEMGQKMNPVVEGFSIVQGVMKIGDSIEGYSDWRKYGKAAVF